jgi:hypothetical protein
VALRVSPLFKNNSEAHSVTYITDNPTYPWRLELNGLAADVGTICHVAIYHFNTFTILIMLLQQTSFSSDEPTLLCSPIYYKHFSHSHQIHLHKKLSHISLTNNFRIIINELLSLIKIIFLSMLSKFVFVKIYLSIKSTIL